MSIKTGILVAIGVIAAAIGLSALGHRVADERRQDRLDQFYAAPAGYEQAEPGTLLRVEALPSADVEGATAYRILFRTVRQDGSPAVSGGIAYVPAQPAPTGGRPVLAWAHGTIGLGRGCAPSRRADPVGKPGREWIPLAARLGFAVVAPDYAGLGTTGPPQYLLGRSEAHDVVNAVRALDDVPAADPGRSWSVMGHSQGGHAALWTAQLAEELMPDRDLVGVAAISPAADLVRIIEAQWASGIGWAVGAEVYASWPAVTPDIDYDRLVSAAGRRWYQPVADACLGEGVPAPAIAGLAAAALGVPFFDENPVADPQLYEVAAAQTPQPPPNGLPLLVLQGTGDTVIPPDTNAALQVEWCAAGSDLSMVWLGGVGHIQALAVGAVTAVPWLFGRFSEPAPTPSCAWPPPVGQPIGLLADVGEVID
ncbi:MAG: alpha/beta fold hydrolase [Gaiellales bacterium]